MKLFLSRTVLFLLVTSVFFTLLFSSPFQDVTKELPPSKTLSANSFSDKPGTMGSGEIKQRKFPYPYKAMLAFSSDIDGTTPVEFIRYHRFLNSKEETPMGKGLGLDIADSFWMYMGSDFDNPKYMDNENHTRAGMMTYYNGLSNEKKDAKLIQYYWNKGWIDSMHSMGDFNRRNSNDKIPVRKLSVQAWNALKQDQIQPEIWINHGDTANKDNFGAPPRGLFSYQKGDVKGSPFYHTDITIKNGIHFVWNSVCDNQFGFDSVLFPIKLQDGQSVWGFHRYGYDLVNGVYHWTWGADKIDQQITQQRLDELVAKEQYAVIANHFGGLNGEQPFPQNSVKALQLLASYHDSGKVLVARTSRLLHYDLTRRYLNYKVINQGTETNIVFHSIKDPLFGEREVTLNDVRGMTFYAVNPRHVHFFIKDTPIANTEMQMYPEDETGNRSVGVKWFQKDTTDYSATAPSL